MFMKRFVVSERVQLVDRLAQSIIDVRCEESESESEFRSRFEFELVSARFWILDSNCGSRDAVGGAARKRLVSTSCSD